MNAPGACTVTLASVNKLQQIEMVALNAFSFIKDDHSDSVYLSYEVGC